MWDLIVSVPDHCLSFYFSTLLYGNFDDILKPELCQYDSAEYER